MKVYRGDVVLVPIRFTSGSGTKLRPVLVIQADNNNRRLNDTIVVVITSTIARAVREPTQLLVDISTAEGKQSGLLQNSAVTCEHIHTILQSHIYRKIGSLTPATMLQVKACL